MFGKGVELREPNFEIHIDTGLKFWLHSWIEFDNFEKCRLFSTSSSTQVSTEKTWKNNLATSFNILCGCRWWVEDKLLVGLDERGY